jgi:hypothetical protein
MKVVQTALHHHHTTPCVFQSSAAHCLGSIAGACSVPDSHCSHDNAALQRHPAYTHTYIHTHAVDAPGDSVTAIPLPTHALCTRSRWNRQSELPLRHRNRRHHRLSTARTAASTVACVAADHLHTTSTPPTPPTHTYTHIHTYTHTRTHLDATSPPWRRRCP